MNPTLAEGDVVVANRPANTCGTSTVTPGDMIIQDRDGVPWIRRVVAGPGQTVEMHAGVLFIDEVPVELTPLRTETTSIPASGPRSNILAETLPNGRTYEISDFGDGGPFDDTPRVTLKAGEWFGLGDARDNSIDSRLDGPIRHKHICGIIYAKQEAGQWKPISAPLPTTKTAAD
jgi:signal peptidase I